MKAVNVQQATQVKWDGGLDKIASKWGISPEGHLAKPSEGGFGVVTEDGHRVGMWDAIGYYVEEPPSTLLYHYYLSSACLHLLHKECPVSCEFCSAICYCHCHIGERRASDGE